MFTDFTYQDYIRSEDKPRLLLDAIARYKVSRDFKTALEATAYFRGENTAVGRKTILRARKVETRDENGRRRVSSAMQDVVGNRIGSAFLHRFVTQQNQYLLSGGCMLPSAAEKAALGADFDHLLYRMGEKALLHGVCWAYWNCDHLEMLESAVNHLSGFFPLVDEMNGKARVGVQFWQISLKRPLYIRIFEENGVSLWMREKGRLTCVAPKRDYVITYRSDALGEEVLSRSNYSRLPIFPLYGNSEHVSEFTPAIHSKIDAYDRILSDFADNLDRANDIYWVLNNFGGTTDEIAEMLEEINRVKAIANLSDGSGASATAEPHTIEVPYAARKTALDILERALYSDYMALNTDEITGGSLTNVAIRVAMANMNLKADRYEWEVYRFMRELLAFLNIDTEEIRFQRQEIGNASETIANISVMRPDIDRRTALKLNPYIQPEEVDVLMQDA